MTIIPADFTLFSLLLLNMHDTIKENTPTPKTKRYDP